MLDLQHNERLIEVLVLIKERKRRSGLCTVKSIARANNFRYYQTILLLKQLLREGYVGVKKRDYYLTDKGIITRDDYYKSIGQKK